VKNAFHALAIDEKRGPFRPTLWEPHDGDVHPPDQRLEQVWFCGVHCGVGGGYSDTSLSDIALLWMVQRAQECGLAFNQDAFPPLPSEGPPDDNRPRLAPKYDGKLQESRTGLYLASLKHHRRIGEGHARTESVASTAVLRHQQLPSYRPKGLSAYLDRRGRQTDLDPDFKDRGFDCP
jgi:hypothetical protein